MSDIISKIIRKTVRGATIYNDKYRAVKYCDKLTRSVDFQIRGIGEAVKETLEHRLSSVEERSIKRIEERRKFLNKDNSRLTFIDFGAGSPDEHRTRDESDKGVVKETTVAQIAHAS